MAIASFFHIFGKSQFRSLQNVIISIQTIHPFGNFHNKMVHVPECKFKERYMMAVPLFMYPQNISYLVSQKHVQEPTNHYKLNKILACETNKGLTVQS